MTGFPSSIVRLSGFADNAAAGKPPRGVTSVEADASARDPRLSRLFCHHQGANYWGLTLVLEPGF
jgi:hypothetical protein